MEFATYFLAQGLAGLPETSVGVACSTMPEVPRGYPYPFPVQRHRSLSFLTPYLRRRSISSLIDQMETDILHGMMLSGGGHEAVETGARHGIPTVVHSHGSDVQLVDTIGYGERRHPLKEALIRDTLTRANAIVAVSTMNREMILELGASHERVHVIPNGCQYGEIGRVPFRAVRKELELEEQDFVIISVGRASPIKRLHLLFEALGLLRNHVPRVRCICVGPRSSLQEMAKEHGVEGMVRCTGAIPAGGGRPLVPPFPELVHLYRTADAYVSTSYCESFGMGALDAIACGTPVVLLGTRHGVRDAILEGFTGHTVHSESSESLAESLIRCSGRVEEMRENRDRIRATVAAYDWTSVAAQTRQLYRKVLRKAR